MAEVTPAPAGVAETHSSWVLFLGDRAFKIKKPVKLDFLDFSTREAREAAAHREVELNRRLAPDVYLGVADVVGPDGKVCDHVVMMRRLPAERRLSTLVRAGGALDDEIRDIARTVASFHARAATSPAISAAGAPQAIRSKVEHDLEDLRRFAGAQLDAEELDEVGTLVDRYLAGRTPLLKARADSGYIRDGHGDLLADDIFCLSDGPRILDCIDFDDVLRYGDVLADVAFLAMHLEHLGSPDLAARFLTWYCEFTNEHHPDTLADYYIAFRALIRSKVACTRVEQGDSAQRSAARSLLTLARRHLRRARVRLVLVGGPPGVGKSTLAAGLSQSLGWSVLRSDEVRKDITGVGRAASAESSFGSGIYDAPTTAATYSALLERARRALAFGESVILDASWSRDMSRRAAAEVARDTTSDLIELSCDAPVDVALARVTRRRAQEMDASDATSGVATEMRAAFEPWPSATVISTIVPPQRAVDAALAALDVDIGTAGARDR